MHVEVQFSQSKSSSYIQSQEQPIYFFKTRSRGLTSADPWNIIQGSGTDYLMMTTGIDLTQCPPKIATKRLTNTNTQKGCI